VTDPRHAQATVPNALRTVFKIATLFVEGPRVSVMQKKRAQEKALTARKILSEAPRKFVGKPVVLVMLRRDAQGKVQNAQKTNFMAQTRHVDQPKAHVTLPRHVPVDLPVALVTNTTLVTYAVKQRVCATAQSVVTVRKLLVPRIHSWPPVKNVVHPLENVIPRNFVREMGLTALQMLSKITALCAVIQTEFVTR